MKFLLLGVAAILATQAQSSNHQDFFYNNLLNKYGDKYQNNNIGLGQDNKWSGQNNKWVGNSNKIQGVDQFVVGDQNNVNGRNNNVMGNRNQVKGVNSRVQGESNNVSGEGNVVIGSGNVVSNSGEAGDLDTDSWFPDWMKDDKTKTIPTNNKDTKNTKDMRDTYFHNTVSSQKNKYDNSDMNFPSWMTSGNPDDFWKPTQRQQPMRSSKSNLRPSYSDYTTSYSRRPTISTYQREFRYPYATNFYAPQPSYRSPWNSWQQFYHPSFSKIDFFRQPYLGGGRNSYRYQW